MMPTFLVRVRVTRVHEHEVVADDASAAAEIGLELADEGSQRDSFDDVALLDVTWFDRQGGLA